MLKGIKEIVSETIDRIDKIGKGEIKRMLTGSVYIDKFTDGLEEGSFNIVAARPGSGKTSFVVDLINGLTEKSAFYSIEMNEWELGRKMLSRSSGINSLKFNNKEYISRNSREIAKFGFDLIKKENLFFSCETSIDVGKIYHDCKDNDFKLIVIDYLQIMRPRDKTKRESKAIEIGGISQDLKHMAKDLNIPIVALSQLGRGGDARNDKMPNLSDLRWAGEIEENAHKIIFLHYPHKYDKEQPKNKLQIIMGKNRSGIDDTIHEFFVDYSTSTFREWTMEDENRTFMG